MIVVRSIAFILAAAVVAIASPSAFAVQGPGRSPPPPAPPAAREALVIPPPPAIPGAPAPSPEVAPEVIPSLTPEEEKERRAEADASPRRSNFGDQRPIAQPAVPAAPVRVRQQIKLTPGDAMMIDRSAISDSLRVSATDLRNPSGFTNIYEVDQRPDVLVRANGAVYAVFPLGDYALVKKDKRPYVQVLVPPGTMYYIGEPNWRRVWLPGIRGMMPKLRLRTAEEFAADTPPASSLQRVEATMPLDYSNAYVRPVLMEDFPGVGLLSSRIETLITPSERAFNHEPQGPPIVSRDEIVPHPVLAPSIEAGTERAAVDPQATAPPMHTDVLYRRNRMSLLLDRAAQQGAGPRPAQR